MKVKILTGTAIDVEAQLQLLLDKYVVRSLEIATQGSSIVCLVMYESST